MIHIPTESQVGLLFAAVLAILYGVVKVLKYVNSDVMPQVRDLKTNVALLKQHADTSTARLNGQSAKIDTLLLATPPTSPVTVNAAPPSSVTVNETSAQSVVQPPAGLSTPATAPAPVSDAPDVNTGESADAGKVPITAGEVTNALGHD